MRMGGVTTQTLPSLCRAPHPRRCDNSPPPRASVSPPLLLRDDPPSLPSPLALQIWGASYAPPGCARPDCGPSGSFSPHGDLLLPPASAAGEAATPTLPRPGCLAAHVCARTARRCCHAAHLTRRPSRLRNGLVVGDVAAAIAADGLGAHRAPAMKAARVTDARRRWTAEPAASAAPHRAAARAPISAPTARRLPRALRRRGRNARCRPPPAAAPSTRTA